MEGSMEGSMKDSMKGSMEGFDGRIRWKVRWKVRWKDSIEGFDRRFGGGTRSKDSMEGSLVHACTEGCAAREEYRRARTGETEGETGADAVGGLGCRA